MLSLLSKNSYVEIQVMSWVGCSCSFLSHKFTWERRATVTLVIKWRKTTGKKNWQEQAAERVELTAFSNQGKTRLECHWQSGVLANKKSTCTSLLAYLSRANMKLHNILVTPKLVKKVVAKLDSTKASGLDCIPVVVLKICEHEYGTFSYFCSTADLQSFNGGFQCNGNFCF